MDRLSALLALCVINPPGSHRVPWIPSIGNPARRATNTELLRFFVVSMDDMWNKHSCVRGNDTSWHSTSHLHISDSVQSRTVSVLYWNVHPVDIFVVSLSTQIRFAGEIKIPRCDDINTASDSFPEITPNAIPVMRHQTACGISFPYPIRSWRVAEMLYSISSTFQRFRSCPSWGCSESPKCGFGMSCKLHLFTV